MANFHILIILLCHFVCSLTLNYTESIYSAKNGGYLFAMSRVVVAGNNHTVCLSLHDLSIPATCTISMRHREHHFAVLKTLNSEYSCFELFIPKINLLEPHLLNVKVQIQSNDYIHSAHNLDPILVYPSKWSKTFIDTDRGVYKPGDKIKFRILVVDEKLLPVYIKVPKIAIVNPLDVRVAVWEEVGLENGLVSLEYEMVREALVGKWKIECLGEVKVFEVSKYVLPRFSVSLQYPRRIFHEEEYFTVFVCAHYSHGRPVKGLAFIKVTDSYSLMKPINRLKGMENGCGEFNITKEDLNLKNLPLKIMKLEKISSLHLSATITEKGTNKIEIVFGKIIIDFQPFKIKFSGDSMFQPGLPYYGKLKLSNVNVNLSREAVEVCYNIAIKKSWNYANDKQCSNFSLNEDNELSFQVLPMNRNVIHINFYAKSLNHSNIEDSFLVVRLFSNSNSYINLKQITHQKELDECRPLQEFNVTFTADYFKENEDVTFYYMIKSTSKMYKLEKIVHKIKRIIPNYFEEMKNILGTKHKYSKLGAYVDNFSVKFKLNNRIISSYQFLVYYISKTGETIAASTVVEVEPCLMKVVASWNQQQMIPGATAQLNINTTSQSLCSISAVDKSIKFLESNYRMISRDLSFKSFHSENRAILNTSRDICVVRDRPHRNSHRGWNLVNSIVKRYAFSFAEDYDAFDVFNNFGSIIITNLKVVSKSCYLGPALQNTNKVQFLTQQYDNENEEQITSIRSHFTETWLWELIPLSGAVQIKRHLPHAITSYVTNVLCVSETEGVGMIEEMEIVSFQNIFVEVLAPYSIKKEELFYLNIHVSNYRSHSVPIRINVLMSSGLEVYDKETKLSTSTCIDTNDTFSYRIKLKANMLGLVNVSALAETDNQYPMFCGPETIVFKRDSEIKSILVEPEGFFLKKTKSALLCSSGNALNSNVSWFISAPPAVIPGTYKAHVSLNGEILGNTIENLDHLLDMPSGCGEQIMAAMAPNLYVMKYLEHTNSLKRTVKQKIQRNLKIGYQRILNYIHQDGSFSAFGYYDPMGSMFLTTFVVKILSQAKDYIYVDPHVISKAVDWIFDRQLENGCFSTMLHVFQDMGGASKENSTASLTSYVVISLLEANIEIPDKIKTNAKFCIRSQVNPNKYSIALNCYAMFKLHSFSEANKLLKRLLAVSEQYQNMLWWSNKGLNTSSASDIETTSYALMSLLHQNSSEHWAHALAVIRWLSSKYGSKGSFVSTQDTVVALDALSRYLHLVETKKLNLVVSVQAITSNYSVTLTDNDSLKSRRVPLKEENGTVSVKIDGRGCVLVQVIQTFNLKNVPTSEAFNFAMEVLPVSTVNQCAITSLSPCLSYMPPNGLSNMAVMEISLPTGYQVDRSSLYKLVEFRNVSRIEMFEEKEDKINLYFTKLDQHLVCFTFTINENFVIEDRKNSLVKIYDYYNPEYEIKLFYNISGECKKLEPYTGKLEEIDTGSFPNSSLISTKDSTEKSDAYL